jgi:predicted O-linked N-acetylglucosamine transferase (SPINDLY family)/predicted SAM-dependent methyltransferase
LKEQKIEFKLGICEVAVTTPPSCAIPQFQKMKNACFQLLLLIVVCLLTTTHQQSQFGTSEVSLNAHPTEIRQYLDGLSKQGKVVDIVNYLEKLERFHGTLNLDNQLPSLYSFLGVSLYTVKRTDEAIDVFQKAVSIFPNETRAWINLGEIQIQKFYLNDAIYSFTKAFHLGEYSALPRIIRTKGWSLNWQDWETFLSDLERFATLCSKDVTQCIIDSSSGLEYSDASPLVFKYLTSLSPNVHPALQQIESWKKATIWKKPSSSLSLSRSSSSSATPRRLKVGFISSDFGIHPVSTLIRGLLQMLDRSKFEIYCFSLQNAISWWGGNISTTVEHFMILENSQNLAETADQIASYRIEILIELNGHTMFSGLPLLSYSISPIQISYLGLPTTTAASFIDYYISDYITIPPEHSSHFSESLALMKPCYIANDYAQVQGAVALSTIYNRADRDTLGATIDLSKASIILTSLSNSQKMDPFIFHVWMNIMNRFSGSVMVFVEYAGHEVYMKHLIEIGKIYGFGEDRLLKIPQVAWIDHLYSKTAIDLVLDTPSKNAHTTGLDGIWSGIPTITLAGGRSAPARSGESIAKALNSEIGLTYSVKEYEDLAFSMIRKKQFSRQMLSRIPSSSSETPKSSVYRPFFPPKKLSSYSIKPFIQQYPILASWRKVIYEKRLLSSLFDTPQWTLSFEKILRGIWEIAYLQKYHKTIRSLSTTKKYHLFPTISPSKQEEAEDKPSELKLIRLGQVYEAESEIIPREILEKLNYQDNISMILSYRDEREKHGKKRIPFRKKDIPGASLSKNFKEDSKRNYEKSSNQRDWKGSNSHNERNQEEAEDGNDNDEVYEKKKTSKKIKYQAIPHYIFDGRNIMLNIGGVRNAEGWININSKKDNYGFDGKIDVIREMHDLKGFANNTIAAIYSSHTLEHTSFGDRKVFQTLEEWFRVLRPGGILLLAVPDLLTLSRMYLDPEFTLQDRWLLTQMIYGGQTDEGDYHHVSHEFFFLFRLSFFLSFVRSFVRSFFLSFVLSFFRSYFLVFSFSFPCLSLSFPLCVCNFPYVFRWVLMKNC